MTKPVDYLELLTMHTRSNKSPVSYFSPLMDNSSSDRLTILAQLFRTDGRLCLIRVNVIIGKMVNWSHLTLQLGYYIIAMKDCIRVVVANSVNSSIKDQSSNYHIAL